MYTQAEEFVEAEVWITKFCILEIKMMKTEGLP
jgi:hypothetical protein